VDWKKRPSDFALRHVFYPPALWRKMTECIPGLVGYKKNLLKEANVQRDHLANRRQQKRLADGDEGGGAAKRTRGA